MNSNILKVLSIIQSVAFVSSLLFSTQGFASEQSASLDVAFKKIPALKLLVVECKGDEHIAHSFAELVAYYNRDNTTFDVVFPQMSLEFSDSKQWIAVAYTGMAQETSTVKIKTIPPAKIASALHKGSYPTLGVTIRKLYQHLYANKMFPDTGAPLRLLYLNSPDDNHPKDLLTEIQIALE